MNVIFILAVGREDACGGGGSWDGAALGWVGVSVQAALGGAGAAIRAREQVGAVKRAVGGR